MRYGLFSSSSSSSASNTGAIASDVTSLLNQEDDVPKETKDSQEPLLMEEKDDNDGVLVSSTVVSPSESPKEEEDSGLSMHVSDLSGSDLENAALLLADEQGVVWTSPQNPHPNEPEDTRITSPTPFMEPPPKKAPSSSLFMDPTTPPKVNEMTLDDDKAHDNIATTEPKETLDEKQQELGLDAFLAIGNSLSESASSTQPPTTTKTTTTLETSTVDPPTRGDSSTKALLQKVVSLLLGLMGWTMASLKILMRVVQGVGGCLPRTRSDWMVLVALAGPLWYKLFVEQESSLVVDDPEEDSMMKFWIPVGSAFNATMSSSSPPVEPLLEEEQEEEGLLDFLEDFARLGKTFAVVLVVVGLSMVSWAAKTGSKNPPRPKDDASHYNNWSVKELQKALSAKGLPVAGLKEDLIHRLMEEDTFTMDTSHYERLNTPKLKQELKKRKLSPTGIKKDLIRRLAIDMEKEYEQDLTTNQVRRKLKLMGVRQDGSKSDLVRRLVELGPQ